MKLGRNNAELSLSSNQNYFSTCAQLQDGKLDCHILIDDNFLFSVQGYARGLECNDCSTLRQFIPPERLLRMTYFSLFGIFLLHS